MRRIAVLTVGLCLLGASSAQARQRPVRMTFGLASTIAVDYWANHGAKVPCQPSEHLLTWKDTKGWGYEIHMLAKVAACRIDITPWAAPLRNDRDTAWVYCQDIVHEVGHLAGLEHEDGGVMATRPTVVPWGCDHPRKFRSRSAYASVRDGFGRR